MLDQDKGKQQLIEELAGLRQRVAALESSDAERKSAEDALRQSEGRYRALAESTRDIIFILDGQGTLLYANQAASQCIGIPAADIVGKRQVDLFPPEMARSQIEKTGRVFATGEVIEYDDLFHFGPAEVWLRIHLIPIRDEGGKRTSVMGVCHNITRRKQAEEALQKARDELEQRVQERTAELTKANGDLHREIEERKRSEAALFEAKLFSDTIIESIPGPFYVVDRNGKYVRWNKTQQEIAGVSSEAMPQTNCLATIHEDDRESVAKPLAEFNKERAKTHVELQARVLTQAGVRDFSLTGKRMEIGETFFIVGCGTDITERKRAEEALAKEHRNLRYMLRSSDNERQLIAYEIHDGLAQQLAGAIMQFQAHDHLKDTQPKQAADAYHAGLTMLQQGHFETRRLIAGVRPPILDEAGIAEAVSHLVHEHGRERGPKIDFHSRVDFDRLDSTFENAIYRIAQEALTNACKHSKSERISVGLLQCEDRLRIEIRDWGVGFDPKTAPKNRFGLEGIRQRARLLGGKCSIRSVAGKGTRITVELPVIPRDEEA
jgi:PAS domain S-box-containing protein